MELTSSICEKIMGEKGQESFEGWYENAESQPRRYLDTIHGFEKAFGTDAGQPCSLLPDAVRSLGTTPIISWGGWSPLLSRWI